MRVIIASTAAAILCVQSGPALSQGRNVCADAKDQVQAIRACSEIIRNHPKDAAAYHLRGNALARNGDVGQAIADYDKAIRLNSNYGPAYDSRALAYTSKGDHARALADATKSTELAKMGQDTPATVTVKAKPKTTALTPTKQAETKQEAPTFNPFQDRSSY